MQFNVLKIDHIVLRVRDLPVMRDFYMRVLGCTMERVQEELGLYQLRAGESLIDLVTLDGKLGRAGGEGPGAEGRNLDHFCLRIEPFDVDSLRDWLTGQGVAPGEHGTRFGADGTGPSLYLSDPEGNVVELKGPPTPTGG